MSVTAPPAAAATRRRPRWLSLPLEIVLVTLGAVGVVAWTNRAALRGLTTTAPGDLGDPLYFAWQLAWVRHALGTDPAGLWTTPAFGRTPDNLAFTDTVLGYVPLGPFVRSGQAGALELLNLATLAAGVGAIVGGYALARAMRTGRMAAVVAGAGFGFAPWRIEQVIHINVISTGGIALSLALLARGSGWSLTRGWEPGRMSARWIAAGWAVACYQLTFGFATGIWFAYSLALPLLGWAVGWWWRGRRRGRLPRSIVVAHGAGGAAFAVVAVLLLQPYLRVVAAYPQAKRGEDWLPLFSPPWRGLLTAPDDDTFWGPRQISWRSGLSWPPEMVLSPGIALLFLAVVGLAVSVYPVRRRIGLGAATVVLTALAMGTAFPWGKGRWTYLPLFRHAPGWSALRTPGRLMIWVTLCLCLLAAGAVARVYRELRPAGWVVRTPGVLATGAAAVIVAVAPPAAVLDEGRNTIPHWHVATSPVRLTSLPAPILLLPTDLVGDYHLMLWGTEGWPVLANGSSGFDPPAQTRLRAQAETFPDIASISELRTRGIRTVVIIRSRALGTVWQSAADRPVAGLGITRRDLGDAVVYDLDPA